jgi:hypothetical protein
MKMTSLAAATLIGTGLVAATPTLAQVELGIGPSGPSVRIGRDDPYRERRYIERRRYDRDVMSTGSVGRCRTVTIREEDEDGDIVTRRVRRCR